MGIRTWSFHFIDTIILSTCTLFLFGSTGKKALYMVTLYFNCHKREISLQKWYGVFLKDCYFCSFLWKKWDNRETIAPTTFFFERPIFSDWQISAKERSPHDCLRSRGSGSWQKSIQRKKCYSDKPGPEYYRPIPLWGQHRGTHVCHCFQIWRPSCCR